MELREVELDGVLLADGTIELDSKPDLPAGRVKVSVRAEAPLPEKVGWWPMMQRIRAEREADGYAFMDEKAMEAHLHSLREDDDRLEAIVREAMGETSKGGSS